MNILILGGNKFVGPLIAERLKRRGHVVHCFNRSGKDYRGDLKNKSDLLYVAKQKYWDVVIHQIAYTKDDVRTVLECFPKIKHLILTSTISVYRYLRENLKEGEPLLEDHVNHWLKPLHEDLKDPHWQYAKGKLETESVLIEQRDIPYTILRQAFVYGPGDSMQRSLWYADRLKNDLEIMLPNEGKFLFNLLFRDDASEAICLAVENESAKNQVFNVAQDEVVSFKEWVVEVGRQLNIEPMLKLNLSSEINEIEMGPLAYNRNWILDNRKIKRILGFRPTIFSEGVQKMLE